MHLPAQFSHWQFKIETIFHANCCPATHKLEMLWINEDYCAWIVVLSSCPLHWLLTKWSFFTVRVKLNDKHSSPCYCLYFYIPLHKVTSQINFFYPILFTGFLDRKWVFWNGLVSLLSVQCSLNVVLKWFASLPQ